LALSEGISPIALIILSKVWALHLTRDDNSARRRAHQWKKTPIRYDSKMNACLTFSLPLSIQAIIDTGKISNAWGQNKKGPEFGAFFITVLIY
jgi:hypothetical protein